MEGESKVASKYNDMINELAIYKLIIKMIDINDDKRINIY
jgi:hypothetical protein